MPTPRNHAFARTPLLIFALLAAATLSLLSGKGAAQPFTEIDPGLPAPPRPCVVFGDYDGDGDLDLLVAGPGKRDTTFTTLYKNTGGHFTDSGTTLLPLEFAAAAWGDFDGDGDLDLAMIGRTNQQIPTTRIYRNDGGTFTSVSGAFTGVFAGAVAWGDYDGDGDLDLLVTGVTSSTPGAPAATRLYRNDAGAFVSVPVPFPDVYLGAVSWGDYDNDGDLDVVITGTASTGALAAMLWRNEGNGLFTDGGANLPGMDLGFATWGDFDSDGDLDLLFGGNSNDGWITRVYRNDNGTFTDTNSGLIGLLWSSAAWGDYDNDGDLDVMLIGYDAVGQTNVSRLYRNYAGGFVDAGETFHNLFLGTLSWVDYDNDGDLDLLLAGNSSSSLGDFLGFYRNDGAVANTPPAAPSNLSVNVNGTSATLSWSAATDAQTPAAALTYNLRVGTTPGGSEIVAPNSLSTGYRLVPAPGNTGPALTARLGNLKPGTNYFWSVQAVDTAFAGSPFAAEGTCAVLADPPKYESITRDGDGVVRITWRGTPGTGYQVQTSGNLTDWNVVATPTAALGTGLFEFGDTPTPSTPMRFYRASRP